MSNLFAQIAAQQQAAAAAATANPVSYVPPSRRDAIRAYPVLRLLAVCHQPTTIAGGTGKTNHWTLTFDVGDNTSVRLDIQPNSSIPLHTNGGQRAQVIVSELNYLLTTHAVRYDIVSVSFQRNVGWYIDYFAAGGRFRYAFHPQGVGCRQWHSDTMHLLGESGNVNNAESEAARRSLACTWPGGHPAAPSAGTYF